MKDYYKILGVDHNASKEDIKKAYRRLAHQYHPDKHTDEKMRKEAETRFKEITEAYHILSNDQRRSQYDTFSTSGFHGSDAGWDFSGFGQSGFSDFSNIDIGEIFGDFFGFGRAKHAPRRGRDISIDIEITFDESVFGTERRMLIRKMALCSGCGGSGAEEGFGEKTCSRGHGSGTIRTTKQSFFASFSQLVECDLCGGIGKLPEKACKKCSGSAVIPQSEEVRIVVPPSVRSGEMIRLSGKGEAIARGDYGDLYVKVHVLPHKVFRRENDDIHMQLIVPLSQAMIGGEQEIETLDGKIKIKIPHGTQTGDMLRVRGKGFVREGDDRGDLIINVIVRMPKRVSKKLRAIAEEIHREGY